MEVDEICQLLNQLELNLIYRKPFVNQLLGINSFCDKTERFTAPSNLTLGYDNLVDEGFASPSVCVVEDTESYIAEITRSGVLHLDPLNKGSNFVTPKKDTINPKFSDEKKETTVVNYSKLIEIGVSEDRKLCASDDIVFFGCSSVAVVSSFQAKVDSDPCLNLNLAETRKKLFICFSEDSVNYIDLPEIASEDPVCYNSFRAIGVKDSGDLVLGLVDGRSFAVSTIPEKSQSLTQVNIQSGQSQGTSQVNMMTGQSNGLVNFPAGDKNNVLLTSETYRYLPSISLCGACALAFIDAVVVYFFIIISLILPDFSETYEYDKNWHTSRILPPKLTYVVHTFEVDKVMDPIHMDYCFSGQLLKIGFFRDDAHYLAAENVDTSRQIRLDFYLFSRDSKCLNKLVLQKYVANLMLTVESELDLQISCSECLRSSYFHLEDISFMRNSYFVQVDDCCGMDQVWYCCNTNENVKNMLFIRDWYLHLVVTSIDILRQIQLDIYLFSREWIGILILVLKDSDRSYLINLKGRVTLWSMLSHGMLGIFLRGLFSGCVWKDGRYFWLVVCLCGSSCSEISFERKVYAHSRQGDEVFISEDGLWFRLELPCFKHHFHRMFVFRVFSSNHFTLLIIWDDLLVFSLHSCCPYLAVRPLSQLSPTGAWDGCTYVWYRCKMNPVFDYKWSGWMFQQVGFFLAGLQGVFHYVLFSNQSFGTLLFGGNWSWFTFVSHPAPWRSDAPLYVTRGSFMRIKRQHTHVLKGAPVVVYCNQGRSDADVKLAESEISSV